MKKWCVERLISNQSARDSNRIGEYPAQHFLRLNQNHRISLRLFFRLGYKGLW
jgi:hypothetical protein